MKRSLLGASLLVLLTAGWWGYRLRWGQPLNIDHFYERVLLQYSLDDPELLTRLAVIENTILDFHSDDLTHASAAYALRQVERARHNLADYQAIIDEISENLSKVFDLRPKARVEVRRLPKFKEAFAPNAYYRPPPSLDGNRHGIFYVNLRDIGSMPKFTMRTLAYHEADLFGALGLDQETFLGWLVAIVDTSKLMTTTAQPLSRA